MEGGRTRQGRGAVRLAASLVVALTMSAWLALTAIPAQASPATCTFTAGTSGVLSISLAAAGETDVSVVVGAGGVINVVDGATILTCTGGQATVTTVDTINVGLDGPDAGVQAFTIDLSGGPFAPGQTVETSGVNEIEFNVDLGTGGGDRLVVSGSSGPDTITFGSSGAALNADNDPEVTTATIDLWVALGLGGDDVISGQGGNGTGSPTTIPVGSSTFPTDGGEGNDTISGGNSATGDVLFDTGASTLDDPDNDTLNGFEGPDDLFAGPGDDTLDGGNGNDEENGGFGDDRYFQGTLPFNGSDSIGFLGATVDAGGVDTVDYSGRTLGLTIDLDGFDSDDGTTDADFITPGPQSEGDTVLGDFFPVCVIENVLGGSGNDSITGNGLCANVINGGPGDDTLNGLGPTTTPGDTVDYSNAPAAVTVDLAAGTATGGAGNDTLSGFESVNGSAFGDALTGSAAPNEIQGNAGDDAIDGGAGGDDLFGGAGNDTVSGGDGADELFGDQGDFDVSATPDGNDTLNGGAGSDDIWGEGGNDTVDGGDGSDFIVGGSGNDTLNDTGATTGDEDTIFGDGEFGGSDDGGPDGNDTINAGPDDDTAYGEGGADLVNGEDGDDALEGNDGDDELHGGAGDDDLGAFAADGTDEDGRDRIFGEDGDDLLDGGNDGDLLDGGPGDDEVGEAFGSDEGGNDRLRGGEGDDSFDGGSGADTVDWSQADPGGVDTDGDGFGIDADTSLGFATGEGEDSLAGEEEIFLGSRYSDTIRAGETFSGGDLNVRIRGGRGNDVLTGADGNDTLTGGAGRDLLRGAGGDDTLFGNAGNDRLLGGAGNDLLNGGDGTDFGNGGAGSDFCRKVENRVSCRRIA
jgi:Ca2+-binding RTX toxin-like protein